MLLMDLTSLLDKAIQETKNITSDDKDFIVKDLFKGYEWNRISIPVRLRLGILFLTKVEAEPGLNIMKSTKTSSNQQKYKILNRKED
jgi:hypothetical protein